MLARAMQRNPIRLIRIGIFTWTATFLAVAVALAGPLAADSEGAMTDATGSAGAAVATVGSVGSVGSVVGREKALLGSSGSAIAPSRSSGAACAFRDPEDGACYPSADAADRAWLVRGGAPVPVLTVAELAAGDDEADDEDDDDSEDGGAQAPVDSLLPPPGGLPNSITELQSPAHRSFWKNLTRTVKGLVVRKSDSLPFSLSEEDLSALFQTDFPLPIEQFPAEKFRDSFNAPRGRHRRHHAIDLPAPRGTPVVAVVDGTVERMGRDKKGGNVCYLRDESGRFTFYYAHLARHRAGLKVGDRVKKGDALGEVGSTGHSTGPHLHFAIFRDVEGKSAWKALVVNPYLIFSGIAAH